MTVRSSRPTRVIVYWGEFRTVSSRKRPARVKPVSENIKVDHHTVPVGNEILNPSRGKTKEIIGVRKLPACAVPRNVISQTVRSSSYVGPKQLTW